MNRAPAETIFVLEDCDENFETVPDAARLAGVTHDFRRDHWAGRVAVAEKTWAKSGNAFFSGNGAVAGVRRIYQGNGGAD